MESRINTSKPDKGQVTAGFFLAHEVFLGLRRLIFRRARHAMQRCHELIQDQHGRLGSRGFYGPMRVVHQSHERGPGAGGASGGRIDQ